MTDAIKIGDEWREIVGWTDRPEGAINEAWVAALEPEEREALGIKTVIEVDEPDLMRYCLGDPASYLTDLGGDPRRVWNLVPCSVEALQTQALSDAASAYANEKNSPMPWNFGDTPAKDDEDQDAGASGQQSIQVRDDDLRNLQSVLSAAMLARMADAPDTVIPVRVTNNLWVQTTADQVIELMQNVFQLGSFQRARFGQIKKAIADATTVEEVMAAREGMNNYQGD